MENIILENGAILVTEKKAELSLAEKFVYYGYCILTLGGAFVIKTIIKKAIIDSK